MNATDSTSTRGSLQKELAPKNAFVPDRAGTSAPRTRSLPQPTQHEPTTKRKNERTTQDPPVYGGPDARSLGPRAGS